MDVLVIGGSVFVGRAVVNEALAAGHRVTMFNRGVSGLPAPDGVTHLIGDRTVAADLEQLRGREFDLVVDTCGYVPADVSAGAEILKDAAGHYAFVSTINVFRGWPTSDDYREAGLHDGFPDATRAHAEQLDDNDGYGWLKVGCEQAVVRAFGADRCSILRAGLIAGPDDSQSGRLPWWLDRIARGGEVLAPGHPDDPMVMIDSRDLAHYALRRQSGAVEVTGPPGRDTRAGLLEACIAATGSDASLTWVVDGWLREQGVTPWVEVPLWIAPSDAPSLFDHRPPSDLVSRPLAETVADTRAWQVTVPGGWQPSDMAPGLRPERERELLAAWHTRP